VESAVEHGDQNSHASLAPQTIRDILNRNSARIVSPEAPVVVVTSAGARYFLRQMAEPALPNLFFISHNEVPPGLRVQPLGTIQ
jgi:flagellar biosynthesis protein FlhA